MVSFWAVKGVFVAESRQGSALRNKLIEQTVAQRLGTVAEFGALIVETGKHTGRAAKERFIVRTPSTQNQIHWGAINRPIEESVAAQVESTLRKKCDSETSYTYQGFVGGFPIQVTSLSPWHSAFAQNMFREAPIESVVSELKAKNLDNLKIQIFHDPYGKLSDYGLQGLPSSLTDTLIQLNPETAVVCIIGTAYAGEIKKSAFTLCNYLLPEGKILPMHASANVAREGSMSSCVLFGLSGTGKTTLSASEDRDLIGDDEIIWTSQGISNLEGGCYAKLIDLSSEKEPEIFRAIHQTGAILENVSFDATTQKIDFTDRSKTENTRGSYPIEAIEHLHDQTKEAAPPKQIVFLTADAFGALPAVAKLNSWQAMYHFMSGYTAKVAGTELGVKEPTAAFSACFGAPFMPRPAQVYAELLASQAKAAHAQFWLLNTGWVGGVKKGQRFPIAVSRALLKAIQSGELEKEAMQSHPVFGFDVPKQCAGVDSKWLEIPQGPQVELLAKRFEENFEDNFSHFTESRTIAAEGGPRLERLALSNRASEKAPVMDA